MANGYVHVQVDGVLYLAHRIIWVLTRHADPGGAQIDHRDGCRANNKGRNLRLAVECEVDNLQNLPRYKTCRSGHPGVMWDASKKRWRAYISHRRKQRHLGYFTSKAAAVTARRAGKAALHAFQPGERR